MKLHTSIADLNSLKVPTDGLPSDAVALPDDVVHDSSASVQAIFCNLESELAKLIEQAPFVLGCVAWLTNERLLRALSVPRFGCSIIVQKEDFLRPDSGQRGPISKQRLRTAYDRLKCKLERNEMPYPVSLLSTNGSWDIEPIRCMGNHNSDRRLAMPRMHNKFLIFCDVHFNEDSDDFFGHSTIEPKAVWTGSFNLSHNASMSLENAVLIKSPILAERYLKEWAHIFGLSEQLNWTSDWVEPEYRIGT